MIIKMRRKLQGKPSKEISAFLDSAEMESILDEIVTEFNVENLDDIIREIRTLKDSGFYERLIYAFKVWKKIFEPSARLNNEELLNSHFTRLAFENLSHAPLYHPPRTDLITFKVFGAFHRFLEMLYYLEVERNLEYEDMLSIYFSGIDERVTLTLDKFDEVSETPKINSKFFLNLKKVKWKDKNTKKLFDKLHEAMDFAGRFIFNSLPLQFPVAEGYLMIFLTGCSAVNDGRLEINENDIVRGYRSYFKLMKADVTKYKVKKELLNWEGKSKGHLICKKCGGYYKLKAGESPEDFEYCQCGGKLKYYDLDEFTIKKAIKEGWKVGRDKSMK